MADSKYVRGSLMNVGELALQLSELGEFASAAGVKELFSDLIHCFKEFPKNPKEVHSAPKSRPDELINLSLKLGLPEVASEVLSKSRLQGLKGGTLAKAVRFLNLSIAEVEKVWDEKKEEAERQQKLVDEKEAMSESKKNDEWDSYAVDKLCEEYSFEMNDECDRYAADKLCKKYSFGMVDFLLELESLGCGDLAAASAADLQFPRGYPEKLITDLAEYCRFDDVEHLAVLALISNRPEYLLGVPLESMGSSDRLRVIRILSKVSGFSWVKLDDSMNEHLKRLCGAELVTVADLAEENAWGKERWEEQREFFRLLLRLGDEGLLGSMVECVSKRIGLLKRLLEEGVSLEEAGKLGDGAKAAMKKLVDWRVEYVSGEPSFGDVQKFCVPAKRLKLCGVVDARQVVDNPRQLRRVHEMFVEKWTEGSESVAAELQRLQALRAML